MRNVETVEYLVDDVDGTAASETLSFGLDGASYKIDLSKKNAKALRNDLAKWTANAHKVKSTRGGRSGRRASRGRGNQASEIRAWAAAQGLSVSGRGRISSDIVEQYNAR